MPVSYSKEREITDALHQEKPENPNCHICDAQVRRKWQGLFRLFKPFAGILGGGASATALAVHFFPAKGEEGCFSGSTKS